MVDKSILCVGYTNWDIVLHSDGIPDPDHAVSIERDHTSSGGSAANTALALASFDADVSILGSVGDDKYGSLVEDALRDGGVDPLLVQSDTVGTTLVYAVQTDRADPRYLAKNEAVGEVSRTDIPDVRWAEFDHVHVTSFSADMATELAQAAAADGKTVSFNPSQGYDRETFEDVVAVADVIFLNEREANLFRDRYNFAEIASETCVVITQGSTGSAAYTPTGVNHHLGFSTTDVVDTIGAGDAFVAGFLHEWLDTQDVEAALAYGNACGAYAVSCVGGVDAVDTAWVEETVAGE